MGLRISRSEELFAQGFNCAQSVAGAFYDEAGVGKDEMLHFACAFGGGVGGLHEICGAVSGMCMATGMKYGGSTPLDMEGRNILDGKIQSLAEEFLKQKPSIICRELLEWGKKEGEIGPDGNNIAFCEGLVKCAAGILEEKLRQWEKEESAR